jgi:hypothetical protein
MNCMNEDCNCECDDDVEGPDFPIPDDALVFETTDNNVFATGTLVQLVGIGYAKRGDGPRSDGAFIWAQPVHLEGMDGDPDPDYWPESWRYFKYDLRPLTTAALQAMRLRARLECAYQRAALRSRT